MNSANPTITINPRDHKSLCKIMDKYGPTTTTMLCGENEDGEATYTSIFNDHIVVDTHQSNGWVRRNVYWRDGTREELFDGKWK